MFSAVNAGPAESESARIKTILNVCMASSFALKLVGAVRAEAIDVLKQNLVVGQPETGFVLRQLLSPRQSR